MVFQRKPIFLKKKPKKFKIPRKIFGPKIFENFSDFSEFFTQILLISNWFHYSEKNQSAPRVVKTKNTIIRMR